MTVLIAIIAVCEAIKTVILLADVGSSMKARKETLEMNRLVVASIDKTDEELDRYTRSQDELRKIFAEIKGKEQKDD